MASILIVCMLAIGTQSNGYAPNVDAIAPESGHFYRITGTLQGDALCGNARCLPCDLARVYVDPTKTHVVAEGHWQHDRFVVTRLLTRCDHP